MDLILRQDRFFSRLVHLIPSDLYQHSESLTGYKRDNSKIKRSLDKDDSDQSQIEESESSEEGKYYKHQKQAMTPQEKKQRKQDHKRQKYSADQLPLQAEDLPINSEIVHHQSTEVASSGAKNALELNNNTVSANKEELRRRLQERIMQLKQARQKKPVVAKEASEINKGPKNAKSNTDIQFVAKNQSVDHNNSSTLDKLKSQLLEPDEADSGSIISDLHSTSSLSITQVKPDFDFNPVIQSSGVIESNKNEKKKVKGDGGKKNRLQRLLLEAQKKRSRLHAMNNSGDPTLQAKAKAEQWNDLISSAAGGKPLIVSMGGGSSPSKAELKLKKALKRKEKQKEKSAIEWAERIRTVAEEKDSRVQKKNENRANKKNRHAVKDESSRVNKAGDAKDSMKNNATNNRAGFEGRKTDGSYLNK